MRFKFILNNQIKKKKLELVSKSNEPFEISEIIISSFFLLRNCGEIRSFKNSCSQSTL